MESTRRGIKWQEPEPEILWSDRMTHNPHFANAENWQAARAMLRFQPREPKETAGAGLQALRIHIRDHKSRDLPVDGRALEAHYGTFVLSQARRGRREAMRLALEVSYGLESRPTKVGPHLARAYELGPEPDPDDIDGRSPSVVTWSDGEIHYLVASDQLPMVTLQRIANSLY